MKFPPGKRITEKTINRLHDRMNTLLIGLAAMTIATHYLIRGSANFQVGEIINVGTKRANAYIHLPLANVFETAIKGLYPKQIEIDFYVGTSPEETQLTFSVWAAGIQDSLRVSIETSVFISLVTNMIAPIFVEYYESFADWLFKNAGKQNSWPMVWQFARVVRNSISHGGNISYGNEKSLSHCNLERGVLY